MPNPSGISVMIADDHKMVRIGLRITIDKSPDLAVIAEATNGQEAISLYRQHKPDVVLMDLAMPEMDGIQATKQILAYDPRARVVALTSYNDITRIHAAVEAGVVSYHFKDNSIKKLALTIRNAYQGISLLVQDATQTLIPIACSNDMTGQDLTSTELRVLKLAAKGLGNMEIARKLFVSKATIKKHISHILAKMNVSNRAEAAVFAVRYGIVNLDIED